MNKKQTGRWMLAALLLAMSGTMGRAGDLAITSFDGTGSLTFNRVATTDTYRVEWAPTPNGPWTNTWEALAEIAAQGSGIVTSSVPMCYRVMASVMGDYLVVDLTGGNGALRYPVTDLDAVPPGGWTDEHKTTKLVLRRIPAGVFTMGGRSTDHPNASDYRLHQVMLTKDFYIGVFEVTQRQWELVMGNRPSYFTNSTYYATRPVDSVSYTDIRGSSAGAGWPTNNTVDATAFMGKLRAKTGLTGFDLPTESQWEYACRAGTTTALNSGYNLTSNNSDARMAVVGRYQHNHPGGYSPSSSVGTSSATAKAGTYLPNAWGLYDMHGNVEEWCLDWYETANPGNVTDPLGKTSGAERVLRGGTYYAHAYMCRAGASNYGGPRRAENSFGFRVAFFLGQQ